MRLNAPVAHYSSKEASRTLCHYMVFSNRSLTDQKYRPERGSFPLDHDGTFCQDLSLVFRARFLYHVYYLRIRLQPLTICLGECKSIMMSYLRCIKSHRGSNDPECRNLSKSYLSCRMDRYVDCPAGSTTILLRYTRHLYKKDLAHICCGNRNLMAPDSFKNLGFSDDNDSPQTLQPQDQSITPKA